MFEGLPAAIVNPFDSLRRRLAVLFAVVLLPPTALSLYLAWNAFEEHSDKARLSVRQFASLVSAYERDFFNDTQRLLVNLAADPAIRTMARPECQEVLQRALENFPEYISISATEKDGTVKCTTSETGTLANLTHRSWFQEAIASPGFTLSDYTVSQDLAEPVIVAASPIRDDDNEIQGVLHIDIDLDWLSLFVRASGVPPEGSVFLLDKNGIVLTSSKFELDQTEAAMPNAATLQQVVDRKLVDFEAIGNDGQMRVYSSVALPHGNVIVLFGLPSATTLGWIERDLLARLLSLAAIWLAGILAAMIGTRLWVTRWVSQLRRTARAYSRGDFSARVDFSRAPVELRDLGNTLVNMADRLEARENDLRSSLAQKDTLLKEIHHRVKNNLQTITSLLNIHLRSVTSAQAHQALEEVQTRVRALALVHHYLYESEDVRVVELRLFVGELCQVLHDTLSGAERPIRIEADVHNITIASERAVPIALLITEAVTNAYKHAFPDGRAGKILVAIHTLDETSALLTIRDDGVGYGAGTDLSTTVVAGRGVGMSLISAFARQLGEDLEVSGPPGTTIALKLRLRAKTEAEVADEVADKDEAESEAAPDGRDETVAAGPSAPATLAARAGSFGKA
jgi:two-component sensor histidine kinase